MGNIIWIIISVILVIFIALSIFSMATEKKRNESLEEKYNNIFAPLMERVREKNLMGDDSLVVKILTDKEDGVLAVRDDNKKLCAVAYSDETLIFPFSDYKSCILDAEGKIILNLSLVGKTYSITISSGKFKNTSIVGKQLLSMANKMKNFLDEMIDEV
ncbi:MAG: hypothetical protein ACI4NB_09160 [Candidatus Ornithospirochaeta sp.]